MKVRRNLDIQLPDTRDAPTFFKHAGPSERILLVCDLTEDELLAVARRWAAKLGFHRGLASHRLLAEAERQRKLLGRDPP